MSGTVDMRDHGEDEATIAQSPEGRRKRDSGAVPDSASTPITQMLGTKRRAEPALDGTTVASPADALRSDEILRSRRLVGVIAALVVGVTAALPFLGGDLLAKRLTYAALVVGAFDGVWMYYITGHPARYTPRRVALGWTMAALALCTGVFYFGVFSAGAIVLVLAIHFVGLLHSARIALFVYGTCAVFQGIAAGLVIGGVTADRGLFHGAYLSATQQLAAELLIQMVMLSAYLLSRASRRSQELSVQRLDQALRAVAQRDALLLEARADLDEALAQIGTPGRYTDQTVGSFRLGVVIGRGAMGEIYRAAHTATGAAAAVKLLHPHAAGKPGYVQRFFREAEAAAALDVPNVVRVLEVGDPSVAVPYMAMELLEGEDLAYYLRQQRKLEPAKLVALVDQVARGITAAGDAGIVHRDLKPQNLFLHAGATWKILDFGVSKLADHGGTLTQGNVVGTPAYMAPEQAQAHEVDHRADVHALGAIAYRALTGQLPFPGKDVPTILYNVVYTMPPRPSRLADVPRAVDAVLAIALAKDPAQRFGRAEELARALADAVRGELPEPLQRRAARITTRHPWGR